MKHVLRVRLFFSPPLSQQLDLPVLQHQPHTDHEVRAFAETVRVARVRVGPGQFYLLQHRSVVFHTGFSRSRWHRDGSIASSKRTTTSPVSPERRVRSFTLQPMRSVPSCFSSGPFQRLLDFIYPETMCSLLYRITTHSTVHIARSIIPTLSRKNIPSSIPVQ